MNLEAKISRLNPLHTAGYVLDFMLFPEHSLVLRAIQNTSAPDHLTAKYWSYADMGENGSNKIWFQEFFKTLTKENQARFILYVIGESAGLIDGSKEVEKMNEQRKLNEKKGGAK